MIASSEPATTKNRKDTMRLYLINPCNSLVSLANTRENPWNRYRVWKPLGLLVLAALTPPNWQVTIIDENIRKPDYRSMPQPDLVGITAFTAQATRAYEIADEFRRSNIPVVMGGIHATMCTEEAKQHVDSVVAGEAELIWPEVLKHAQTNALQPVYKGQLVDMNCIPTARHDLLPKDYVFGSIQTTRGCPLNCRFCSVTPFNGHKYRSRPIENIIAEFKTIKEKFVLIVDDNLIGTTKKHAEWSKELFQAMIDAKLNKKWIAQTSVNFADDDQLLALAAKAGCKGVFVGFESLTPQGLAELGKNFNFAKNRDMKDSVRRIQKHKILVLGSFIVGLDSDRPGIGQLISRTATAYGLDFINALILTPLPGTQLWTDMQQQDRIAANSFPHDWKYYTLTLPVITHQHLSPDQLFKEFAQCENDFYSLANIAKRIWTATLAKRNPLIALAVNLSFRRNSKIGQTSYRTLNLAKTYETATSTPS